MMVTAVDHEDRQREGNDDVAGVGEAARDHAERVAEQDEHEQGEHEREVPAALLADGAADHVGDELVAQLDQRLQRPGTMLAWRAPYITSV